MEISNVNSNPFVTSAKVEEEDEKEVKEEQTGEAAVKNPLEKGETDKAEFSKSSSALTQDEVQDTVERYIKDKIASAPPEVAAKLSQYLATFDVAKFIRDNGNLSIAELYAVLYNKTADYE